MISPFFKLQHLMRCLSLALMSLLLLVQTPTSANTSVNVGNMAPDITLPDKNGVQQSLSNLKGKLVLVNFWVSTQPNCRIQNSNLAILNQKYQNTSFAGANGFTLYTVSFDSDSRDWTQALNKDQLSGNGYHVNDFFSKYAEVYSIAELPTSLLLDESGRIVGKNLSIQEIDRALTQRIGTGGGMVTTTSNTSIGSIGNISDLKKASGVITTNSGGNSGNIQPSSWTSISIDAPMPVPNPPVGGSTAANVAHIIKGGTSVEKMSNTNTQTVTTAASNLQTGPMYKVQVGAFSKLNLSEFYSLSQYGEIQTQPTSSGIKKVLLGDYSSVAAAFNALQKAQGAGYKDAFIVLYNGDVKVRQIGKTEISRAIGKAYTPPTNAAATKTVAVGTAGKISKVAGNNPTTPATMATPIPAAQTATNSTTSTVVGNTNNTGTQVTIDPTIFNSVGGATELQVVGIPNPVGFNTGTTTNTNNGQQLPTFSKPSGGVALGNNQTSTTAPSRGTFYDSADIGLSSGTTTTTSSSSRNNSAIYNGDYGFNAASNTISKTQPGKKYVPYNKTSSSTSNGQIGGFSNQSQTTFSNGNSNAQWVTPSQVGTNNTNIWPDNQTKTTLKNYGIQEGTSLYNPNIPMAQSKVGSKQIKSSYKKTKTPNQYNRPTGNQTNYTRPSGNTNVRPPANNKTTTNSSKQYNSSTQRPPNNGNVKQGNGYRPNYSSKGTTTNGNVKTNGNKAQPIYNGKNTAGNNVNTNTNKPNTNANKPNTNNKPTNSNLATSKQKTNSGYQA
ncbi:MAG: redoxin domain-containing protein, partial [Chitinophagales bacterium]